MNDQQRAAMIRPRGKSEAPHMIAAYRAMQMALEALDYIDANGHIYATAVLEAITALREALAQQDKPHVVRDGGNWGMSPRYKCSGCDDEFRSEHRAHWHCQNECKGLRNTSERMAQPQGVLQDIAIYGQHISIGGKRIDPSDFYLEPEQPQGEPVAGSDDDTDKAAELGWHLQAQINAAIEATKAQPQGSWVDLTAGEIEELFCKRPGENRTIVQEAIAKFKEKNTPPVVPQGEPVAWLRINAQGRVEALNHEVTMDAFPVYRHAATPPVVPQGEPVAWMYKFKTEDPILCKVKRDWADNHSQWKETPLYTTPPFVEAAIETTKAKVLACYSLGDTYQNWVDKIKEIK